MGMTCDTNVSSRWLEDGLDVREIRLLLGHAKREVTQRYLNITDVGVVRSTRTLGQAPRSRTRSRVRVSNILVTLATRCISRGSSA
jgi:hypothetical protein